MPILTRTPGPQVGLYKAHSGIKWWSSEKLEPRMPPCASLPFVVWSCQDGCTKWWLYGISLEKPEDVVLEERGVEGYGSGFRV